MKSTVKLSDKLIENARILGLIQVSDYEFQTSIKSDFKADLSACADSQIAILKTVAQQAVSARDFHIKKFTSLVTSSLNQGSKNYELLNQTNNISSHLANQNKHLVDFLIGLIKEDRPPTLEEVNDIIES